MALPDDDYVAGLIDAQLAVNLPRSGKAPARITLTSSDLRVADEMAFLVPSRVTLVKRPGKKDVCVCQFTGDGARRVLDFAAAKCVTKKGLALAALAYMDGAKTAEDVQDARAIPPPEGDVSVRWASGFFDVRGEIVPAVRDDAGKKKRRASVKLPLPRAERDILPSLQGTLAGRVKKSSPTRLVFESRDAIQELQRMLGEHLRVKKAELEAVAVAE